jgi:hypothetical protein
MATLWLGSPIRVQAHACVRGEDGGVGADAEGEMIDFILGVAIGLIAGCTLMHLAHEWIDAALPSEKEEEEKLWMRYKE